ncbi:MAG: efflux RND transporter permease subunit [Acidobacteria bacterium]|nr:efflux RND transporter permease subunit [Acidobacteriota bacterium]
MNRAVLWLAGNPVAANLLMVLIIVSGLMAARTITVEVFPEVELDRISIRVPYLGAAPEEVESGVVVRIEESIQNIDGIKEIVSTASEGGASIIVELELGANQQQVFHEVTNNVQEISTFPVETERPIIRELVTRSKVMDIAVSGDTDLAALKAVAERVRDGLVAMPDVSQVEIGSVPNYEISIEVSEAALRRHQITFDQVANAVRRSSLDVPGGSLHPDRGEILLRTVGQAYRGAEFEDLVFWTRPDGSRLFLRDVATVVDGFAETDEQARFDEVTAVTVSVYRAGEESALDVAVAVRDYAERARLWLPEGITLTVWQDESQALSDRLAIMLNNGAMGFVLVFVVLSLFLRMRLAFWVSFGIPISFLGAIAVMPNLDMTINMVTCFAFILVLGVLVDDAIMVGENIHRHQEGHGDGLRGAVAGAQEIGKPVIYAVLTTAAAFLPLMFVPGAFGKIFRIIPLVVIPCLLFSLIESLGILPAHLAHIRRTGRPGPWSRFQRRLSGGLTWFVQRGYEPVLEQALRWRYVTAAVGLSGLLLTVGVALGGWTSFRFFPSIENEFMSTAVTMPLGTPAEVTSEAIGRFESGAARLRARLQEETGTDYFRHVATVIGEQPSQSTGGRLGDIGLSDGADAHLGEVTIELAPAELRTYSSEQLGAMWREETGPVPEAVAIELDTSLLDPGEDLDVQLSGPDLEQLRAAADRIKERLRTYGGVYAISDSLRTGKEEMRLDIRPPAEILGLTLQDLGNQVRQAFYGEEVQRIQRGREDIRVMVRYPRDERRSVGDLENLRIRTPDGGEVPFGLVARAESGRGFASIRRVDRNRSVNVTASVDPQVSSASDVIADLEERILPEILTGFPDVFYSFRGAQAAQEESVEALRTGFVRSVILIFALLAIPLRSYVQPFIIMGAIPFGIVGAFWGHLVMGIDVTAMSFFGFVALTGVVVNDSLVMVDFINRERKPRDGADPAERSTPVGQPAASGLEQAIRRAGSHRFRPILLTSLTTFAGLVPMMLDRSLQAAFFIPMAVSLAFGVMFATFVTLLLVPIAYLILDDLQRLPRRLLASAGMVREG